MIKILKKEMTYFESEHRFELDVNGKKVIAFRYEKQDPKFSDFELDVEIQDEDVLILEHELTEDEAEAIKEIVRNES